jgi:hypothetical protein
VNKTELIEEIAQRTEAPLLSSDIPRHVYGACKIGTCKAIEELFVLRASANRLATFHT